MIKNNPYQLLEDKGIEKKNLNKDAKEALDIFDETLEGLKQFPDDEDIKKMAEKIGKEALSIIEDQIKDHPTQKPSTTGSINDNSSLQDLVNNTNDQLSALVDTHKFHDVEIKDILHQTIEALDDSLSIKSTTKFQDDVLKAIEDFQVWDGAVAMNFNNQGLTESEEEKESRKQANTLLKKLEKAVLVDRKDNKPKKGTAPSGKKKQSSKEIMAKAEKALDELAICRMKIREDRKRKIASGEIKPPKKKTLPTKLKDALKKITTIMPEKVKDDKVKIERTERAMSLFLSEIKCIWGLNRIKPIENALEEKFDDLKEKAA